MRGLVAQVWWLQTHRDPANGPEVDLSQFFRHFLMFRDLHSQALPPVKPDA